MEPRSIAGETIGYWDHRVVVGSHSSRLDIAARVVLYLDMFNCGPGRLEERGYYWLQVYHNLHVTGAISSTANYLLLWSVKYWKECHGSADYSSCLAKSIKSLAPMYLHPLKCGFEDL